MALKCYPFFIPRVQSRAAAGALSPMDLVLFQHDQSFVLDRFCEGEFDYVNGVSEVEETEFFRYIGAHKVLPKLAESYPSPREKEEVPLWMYIARNLSMRLQGVHNFHAYPYVVRCGGMLNAFGPQVAQGLIRSATHSWKNQNKNSTDSTDFTDLLKNLDQVLRSPVRYAGG